MSKLHKFASSTLLYRSGEDRGGKSGQRRASYHLKGGLHMVIICGQIVSQKAILPTASAIGKGENVV